MFRMKRLIGIVCCTAVCMTMAAGGLSETQQWLWRNNNLALGMTNTAFNASGVRPVYDTWGDVLMAGGNAATYNLLHDGDTRLLGNFNISLSAGRTYYLTRPFCNDFLRLGLDVKWLSLSITDFSVVRKGYWGLMTCQYDLAEASVEFGPSLTARLHERMLVNVYGRYAPTAAVMFCQDFTTGSFLNYYAAGASFSFSTIGFGFERREGWGQFVEGGRIFGNAGRDDIRYRGHNAGYRAYITLRF